MKKILFTVILQTILLLLISNGIRAQRSGNSFGSDGAENFMPTLRKLARLANPVKAMDNILERNEVPVSTVRDFLNNADSTDDVLWFATASGGFEAYFVRDGFGNRVFYGRDGGWLSSQFSYKEDKLPRYIREAVAFAYPNLEITLAEERQTLQVSEYIVYLEDKFNILVLKINRENQLEELQKLVKTK